MNQTCKKCGKEKPQTEKFFKRTKLVPTGFYRTCKDCCAQYKPNYGRDAQMRRRYKLTSQQYDEKLKEQGGTCALCDSKPESQERRFSVDHDHGCCPSEHSCGKCLRGILCANCNRRVGFIEEVMKEGSIVAVFNTWLERALRYLRKYKTQHI